MKFGEANLIGIIRKVAHISLLVVIAAVITMNLSCSKNKTLTPEEAAVIAVMEEYIKAYRDLDADKMMATLHPDCYGYDREKIEQELKIKPEKNGKFPELRVVSISGDEAEVEVAYTGNKREGGRTAYYRLRNYKGEWKIWDDGGEKVVLT